LKPDPTPIKTWLIVAGLAGEPLPQLFDGFCNRLVAAGVPLARGYVSTATLHPLLWATGIVWQQGRIIDSVDINYGFETGTAWLTSPFRHMLESRTWKLHRRLTGEGALLDYPVLLEFRETGMSEWLGLFYGFGWGLRHHQVEEDKVRPVRRDPLEADTAVLRFGHSPAFLFQRAAQPAV